MEATNEVSRFETRINNALHKQIKRVAKLQHRTVTEFATIALQEAVSKAEKELEQQNIIILSTLDQERFINALLNPIEPTDALKRAFAYNKKMVKNG